MVSQQTVRSPIILSVTSMTQVSTLFSSPSFRGAVLYLSVLSRFLLAPSRPAYQPPPVLNRTLCALPSPSVPWVPGFSFVSWLHAFTPVFGGLQLSQLTLYSLIFIKKISFAALYSELLTATQDYHGLLSAYPLLIYVHGAMCLAKGAHISMNIIITEFNHIYTTSRE